MDGDPRDLRIGDLLSQQGFVRRLARGLLFDDHRVDDVVQQTWVAALEGAPREPRAARTWLARVVRNLVLNEARSDLRRRQREEQAAVPEDQPSVDELMAREALRQQVVQGLLALPQPYRATLVLRYYEDLTPKEISLRTGAPGATVRTRLKRGLELLRERFDREHGGDRNAWCLGLVALARPERAAVGMSAGITAGWLGGLFAMKQLGLVALCLALVLGIGITWNLLGAAGVAPEPAPAGGAVALAQEPGGEERISQARKPAAESAPAKAKNPVAAAETERGFSGFRGRVVAGGAPVGGALVRIGGIDGVSFFDGSAPAGLDLVTGQARTDADGSFFVAKLRPRAVYALSVRSEASGATFRTLDLTPGPGDVVDLGDVALTEQGSIEGRIVGPEGEPLSGAEVWAADLPALVLAAAPVDRLDPHGAAMLLLPAPGAAHIAGTEDFGRSLRAFLGMQILSRFDLVPDAGHAVHVIEAPPWVASTWDLLPIGCTRSGADGSFRLAGVTPGANVLVARKAGLRTACKTQVTVRAGEARNVGALTLARGEAASGTVLDAAGAPVAGAEVRVAALGPLGFCGLAFCEPAATTDAAGRFRVGGLPRGKALVGARRSAAHLWTVVGPLEPGDDVVLRLPAPETFAFRLRSASGRPVTGARFALRAGPFLGELARAGLQPVLPLAGHMHELGEGRYRIEDLAAGTCTLEIDAPGQALHAVMFTLPREKELDVALDPALPFRVLVVDSGGLPVAGAKVFVQRAEAPPWAHPILPTSYGLPRWTSLPHVAGHTGPDGLLDVAALPAGRAHVSVSHPALGQAARTVDLPTDVVRMALAGNGVIEGSLSEKGRPAAAGWRIVAERVEDLPTGMPWAVLETVVGPGAAFRFAGLAPGTWRLSARPARKAATSLTGLVELVGDNIGSAFFDSFGERDAIPVKEIALGVGEVRRVRFEMDPSRAAPGEPGGTIAGSITVDGTPRRGVQVCRVELLKNPVVLAATDAAGSFRLEGVAEGRHQLVLRDPENGFDLWQAAVTLAAGGEQRVDARIRTGVLSGTVVGADGRSAPGLTVRAEGKTPGSGSMKTELATKSDDAGNFTLSGLPEGTWRLIASGPSADGFADGILVAAGDANPQARITVRPFVAVEGTVQVNGPVPADLVVVLWPKDENVTDLYPSAVVRKDGGFSISGVRPGHYEVALVLSRGLDHTTQRRAVPAEVEVTESGVRGLVLREGEVVR